jgi:signal transduction histidine kinase
MEGFFEYDVDSLNHVIRSCIEKVGSLLVKDGIRIRFEPLKDAYICVDIDKTIQAIINILGNCIRYASSEIVIETDIGPETVGIVITDDGEGFSENDFKNSFRRFYKGKKGQIGLGLAISKAIVERHGGSIVLSNAPAGGARFTLRIPVKRV